MTAETGVDRAHGATRATFVEPALSDEALLIRFGNGDPSAATELTRRLAPRVLSLATRVLGNRAEAEDVTQGSDAQAVENRARLAKWRGPRLYLALSCGDESLHRPQTPGSWRACGSGRDPGTS